MTQSLEKLPFTPVYKRVVVEPLEAEEKTAGGLYIPETAQQRANRGRLIAAGLGALDIMASHGLELGDVVLFGKYAGVWEEWKAPDAKSSADVKKLLVLQVDDILGSEGLALRDVPAGVDSEGRHVLINQAALIQRRADPKVT